MSSRLRTSSAPAFRSQYISSRYVEDRTKKHEYPGAWCNPLQRWMEHREQFQSWKHDVQSQYLNKQRQLHNSLQRHPYHIAEDNITVGSSIAAPEANGWRTVDLRTNSYCPCTQPCPYSSLPRIN